LGQKEFEDFYKNIYHDKWPQLLEALQSSEIQVERPNQFCLDLKPFIKGEPIPRSENGLLQYYIMDQASIWAAQSLDVQAGDYVLDMCAAPGGKTLILAEALKDSGELMANELSAARRERLTQVIRQYIAREVRDRVFVTGRDGGLFAKSHVEYFDRILIDAPCSGERHMLQDKTEIAEWKISRTEKLAQRQYALMTAALIALKSGGMMVYSTCSISPLENDGVIAKLMKKKSGFKIYRPEFLEKIAGVQKTEFGYQINPDQTGFGPIYICRMMKD
jgi:5-methylcytosine rRNA methyltransferase NSUN4